LPGRGGFYVSTPANDLNLAVSGRRRLNVEERDISMWALRSMSLCGRRGFTRE
jgi:hypothetical protein